jgi:hypothetical protein
MDRLSANTETLNQLSKLKKLCHLKASVVVLLPTSYLFQSSHNALRPRDCLRKRRSRMKSDNVGLLNGNEPTLISAAQRLRAIIEPTAHGVGNALNGAPARDLALIETLTEPVADRLSANQFVDCSLDTSWRRIVGRE